MLVNLGAAMNVDIIAEGVETDDDVKTLSDLGCSFAQGYYFHRPTTQDKLILLLSSDTKPDDLISVA